jgi:multicomponent Na+:H+ antiporter subunit D
MQDGLTQPIDWIIILPVVLPLLGAALLLMARGARELHWVFASMLVLAVLVVDVALFREALATGPKSMTMGNWLPPFGISFTADAMSAAFAAVAALVAFVIAIYVQGGTRASRPDGLYPLLLLLLAGVSGSFLTGDLFNLYVWFEVMLIASFGLMALGGRRIALDATVKYGFLNFLATTFFLLALGLLYGVLGTLNMSDILRTAPSANAAAMAGIASLFLLAFGMKAAISALLAGLLTKVGVYALLRTLVMLLPASRDILEPLLAAVAILTLVIAPLGAIAETNLRRALGFLVIGGIGAVMLGIALPNENGLAGAATYIVHAMLTMTGLYLVAGVIEAKTGTTDTRRMGGLYAVNAPISIAFLALVMAVSGVPPFLGFWPKLLLLEGSIDASGLVAGGAIEWPALLLAAALLINALLTLIAGTRLWSHIFWRSGHEGEHSEVPNPNLQPLTVREALFGLGTVLVLTLLICLAGLMPNPLLELGRSAAFDLLQPASYVEATGLGGGP